MQFIQKLIMKNFIFFLTFGVGQVASEGLRLQRDGPVARDYINKLEWMRCTVGQRWEDNTCIGDVLLLSVSEANEVAQRMSNLEGGGWRLPTVKELQSIVSKVETRPSDAEPNIDIETFPNTFAGPYWSSDQSFYSKRYQWSVNFFSGQRYNRFYPSQPLAIRLVRTYRLKSR